MRAQRLRPVQPSHGAKLHQARDPLPYRDGGWRRGEAPKTSKPGPRPGLFPGDRGGSGAFDAKKRRWWIAFFRRRSAGVLASGGGSRAHARGPRPCSPRARSAGRSCSPVSASARRRWRARAARRPAPSSGPARRRPLRHRRARPHRRRARRRRARRRRLPPDPAEQPHPAAAQEATAEREAQEARA